MRLIKRIQLAEKVQGMNEIERAIQSLEMCKELMLFDPTTGETHELWQENKDNQELYNACGTAITALQEQLERENRRADTGITATENEALTCVGCESHDENEAWTEFCTGCIRQNRRDLYRRKPEEVDG